MGARQFTLLTATILGFFILLKASPAVHRSRTVMVIPGGDSAYLLGADRLGLVGLGTVSYFVPAPGGKGAAAVSAFGHPVPDGTAGVYAASRNPRGAASAADFYFLVRAKSTGFERVGGLACKRGEGLGEVLAKGLAMNQFGVWGRSEWPGTQLRERRPVPVARVGQVTLGPATLLTNLAGTGVQPFAVEITEVRRQYSPRAMGIVFRVTDARLLDAAGGVALGLSGSPILQNGRLAGIVAYVDPEDQRIGYANYAQWDYETKFGRSHVW